MNSRRLGLALSIPLALTVAACSSSTSGSGSSGSPSGGTSSTTSSSSSKGGTGVGVRGGSDKTPSDAAGLGALLQTGLASTTSAHIDLNVSVGTTSITGSGDEKLANSKLVALQITENIPNAGQIQLIIVGGKTYAKLPSSLNTTGKPYVLITENSNNATIKALASTIDSAQQSASLGTVGLFIEAASSVQVKGSQSVDGVHTTHYAVVVVPSRLPVTFPGKAALAKAGLSSLPVDLYVDDQGRPVEVTEKIAVAGQSVETKILVSKYNAPVTISAPPASEVGTS